MKLLKSKKKYLKIIYIYIKRMEKNRQESRFHFPNRFSKMISSKQIYKLLKQIKTFFPYILTLINFTFPTKECEEKKSFERAATRENRTVTMLWKSQINMTRWTIAKISWQTTFLSFSFKPSQEATNVDIIKPTAKQCSSLTSNETSGFV